MRIGGTSRDSMMTLIPVTVAIFAVLYLLGGPDDALRAMERGASDLWLVVSGWFRR
jgi:hypothetical protein